MSTTQTPSNAVQFAFNANVNKIPPVNDWTILLDKAFTDEPLSREEKNKIADILWGTFGAQSSCYKSMGWMWDMSEAKQVKRILVSFTYDTGVFRTYYAPDKTSLRSVLSNVSEMFYANLEKDG